ncbi:MAG: galactose-1-phosphate uridylyltransferase [Acidobacteria bacterium]|nr:galactose-1-phosphate uridylyltransferase [Acidobacteriota bacterium]
MPEIRQNIITRQWVIIANERAQRPDEFRAGAKPPAALPAHDPACPFCPGNEAETPPEIHRFPAAGQWQVRVVPNKYAALAAEGELVRTTAGLKRTITGVGIHEVIVESPVHKATLARLGDAEVERVLETFLRRYHQVLADPRVEAITLFKNHGVAAGTSLVHPHSQLIGTPIIPGEVRERLETALRFYDDNGHCIFCLTLADEQRDAARVVDENEHFLAFIPFGALSPFHLWIFPKRHCASFGCVEGGELPSLARILRRVLRKLGDGLGDPDYNFAIRTAPKESEQVRYYHWYVSVVPRVSKLAGFELGSGMFINTALPEESAAFLREIEVP